MSKKFIILMVVFVVLLVLVFVFFKTRGPEKLTPTNEEFFEETQARTSKGYKITDDSILINLPAQIESGVDLGEKNNE